MSEVSTALKDADVVSQGHDITFTFHHYYLRFWTVCSIDSAGLTSYIAYQPPGMGGSNSVQAHPFIRSGIWHVPNCGMSAEEKGVFIWLRHLGNVSGRDIVYAWTDRKVDFSVWGVGFKCGFRADSEYIHSGDSAITISTCWGSLRIARNFRMRATLICCYLHIHLAVALRTAAAAIKLETWR